jgi:hypothetical protein
MPFEKLKRLKKKLDKSNSNESLKSHIELIYRDENGMFPDKNSSKTELEKIERNENRMFPSKIEIIDDSMNVSGEDIENFLRKPKQKIPILEKVYRDENGMFSSESKRVKTMDDNEDKITSEDIEMFIGKPKVRQSENLVVINKVLVENPKVGPNEKQVVINTVFDELSSPESLETNDISIELPVRPSPPKFPIPPTSPNIESSITSPRNKRLARLKRPDLIKLQEPSNISLVSTVSIKSEDASIMAYEGVSDLKLKETVDLEHISPKNNKYTLSNEILPVEFDEFDNEENKNTITTQNAITEIPYKSIPIELESTQEFLKQPVAIEIPLINKSVELESTLEVIKQQVAIETSLASQSENKSVGLERSSSSSLIGRISRRNSISMKKSQSSSNISIQESSLPPKQSSIDMLTIKSTEQTHGLPPLPQKVESRSGSRSSVRPNDDQKDVKFKKTTVYVDSDSNDNAMKAKESWSDNSITPNETIEKSSSRSRKPKIVKTQVGSETKDEKLFRKSSKKRSKDTLKPKEIDEDVAEIKPNKDAASDEPKKGWNILKKRSEEVVKSDVENSENNLKELSKDNAINGPRDEEKRRKSKKISKKRSKEVLNSDTNGNTSVYEGKVSRKNSKKSMKELDNTSNDEGKISRKRSKPKESKMGGTINEDEKLIRKSSKKHIKERKASEKLKQDLDIITNELKPDNTLERSVSRGRRSKRDNEDLKQDLKAINNKVMIPLNDHKNEEVSPVDWMFKRSGYNVQDFANDSISIKIHQSDSLVSLLNLRHPMVQVHIVGNLNLMQISILVNIC